MLAFLLLTLLAIPTFFIKYASVVLTWYLVWLIFVLTIPFALFMQSNAKLKALKQQNGWFSESTGLALVDVKLALTPKKTLSVWLFIPPVILSLIPVVHTALSQREGDAFWPLLTVYLSFAALTVVFYFLYRILFHQKAEVVDDNTSINAALTQVRRFNWGKCWLLVTWLTGVFSLVVWMFPENGLAILIAAVAYSAATIVFVLSAEFKTRRLQQKLTEGSGRSVYTDDDEHWIFGMLYNNPNDRHFIVNRHRHRHNDQPGRPGRKDIDAYQPAHYFGNAVFRAVDDARGVYARDADGIRDGVIAGHDLTVYDISFSDIRSTYLLNELPDGTRLMGTGMDTVLKGRFRFDGIGPCTVCLDPRTPPFIVIVTADDTYILGASDTVQTEAVVRTLTARAITASATS
jgi:uncharacterized membrane protein